MKTSKYALPSQAEQLQLQNTDSLMKSNLLHLQADEMLAEVCTQKEFEKKKVQAWLRDILTELQSPSSSSSSSSQKARVRPQLPAEITPSWVRKTMGTACLNDAVLGKYEAVSVRFAAPASVEIVGSHSLKTSTAPIFNIDIAIQMPSASFDARDILNHAYFVKRRLYMYALWHSLEQANIGSTISASLFKGDSRKPLLVLHPSGFRSPISIRIVPTAPPDVFKLTQLRANKNNVRPEMWQRMLEDGKKNKSGGGTPYLDASLLKPTANYNLAILEDVAILTQHRILTQTFSTCPTAKNVLVLFKVWLTQRSMRFALGNIDSHYGSLLVAYLVQTKRIVNQMNPLSAFQVLLRFLADEDMQQKTYDFMSTSVGTREPVEGAGEQSSVALPSFILTHPLMDASSGNHKPQDQSQIFHYNCMWRINGSALRDLSDEARKSIQIASGDMSAFSKVFMNKSSFYDRHDVFFHIPFSDNSFGASMEAQCRNKDSGHGDVYLERLQEVKEALCDQNTGQYLAAKITSVLEEALGNRTLVVRVILTNEDSRGADLGVFHPQWRDKTFSCKTSWILTIGIILNKDTSYRKVDRGPAADDEEAGKRFKEFWGPLKSKLRRFQDGSIVEAVVWDESKHPAKTGCVPRGERIVEEIVRYILARHIPHPCDGSSSSSHNNKHVYCNASQLERFFLPAPGIINFESEESTSSNARSATAMVAHLDADTLSRKAIECLDALRTILTSKMKDLPLMIESVMAACPELRYTALIPPQPHPLLEKEGLRRNYGATISLLAVPLLITARVEAGGRWPSDKEAIINVKAALLLRIGELLAAQFQIQSVPHQDFIDILSAGYIFRLSLVASSEIERLQRPHDSIASFARTTSLDALHHNAVKSLHAQHPSFGNAVRLMSRWGSGHYFTGMLDVCTVELLVASVYVDPDYGVSPSSPSAGFRRALLKLASHDWENLPLVVDFASDLQLVDRLKISSQFQRTRAAMFLVSSLTREQDFEPIYTEATPSKPVLRMMMAAAERSYQLLSSWSREMKEDEKDLERIMDSSLPPPYNFVLRFSKAIIPNKKGHAGGSELLSNILCGPPFARQDVYANLSALEKSWSNLIVQRGHSPCALQEQVVFELRRVFGDIALFLWDGNRGSEVYVILRPAALIPTDFKVLHSTNRLSCGVLNLGAVVAEMLACSNGLLGSVSFV